MKNGTPEAIDLLKLSEVIKSVDGLLTNHMEVKFYVPKKRLNELDLFYYKLNNPEDENINNFKYGDKVDVMINGINFLFEEIKKD